MMTKEVGNFRFFDMRVAITRSAQWGTLGMVIIFTALAVIFTDLTPLDSLIAGILVTLIHWLNELGHQYGHFWMARRIGYPSSGLRLWWFLSTTLYTQPEDKVPPRIHIRRALGGPLASLIMTIALLPLALLMFPLGGMAQFLIVAALLIVAGIGTGAMIPITIGNFNTDGATILHWMRQERS